MLPAREGDAVAEPLVRELVDEDVLGLDRVEEEVVAVDRPGLVLEREADALDVVHDPAKRRERVVAEHGLEELDDVVLHREHPPHLGAERLGRVAGGADDPVVRVRHDAVGGRAGHRPAVHRVPVVFERGRAGAGGDDDVVDEDALPLEDVVARIA